MSEAIGRGMDSPALDGDDQASILNILIENVFHAKTRVGGEGRFRLESNERKRDLCMQKIMSLW